MVSGPIITLEEHFSSTAATDGSSATNKYMKGLSRRPGLDDKLRDVGALRLQHMDAGQVTMQVISHTPGPDSGFTPEKCRSANDQLAAAVKANPTRFAGFAKLAMEHPSQAASELGRCVKELGFVGALVDSHIAGPGYYDGAEYDVFWQAAQDLDVPVYIHPTTPTPEMEQLLYTGNFPEEAGMGIAAWGFGWHSDTANHVLRLFAAGVFERFPQLKIVVGHFGEMLPYILQRVDKASQRWGHLQRKFKEVWDSNIWITTSGNWGLDPLACIVRNTKLSRVMYSVDYPFSNNEDGLKWLNELEQSGLVTAEELEMIQWRNAAGLLKVDIRGGQ